MALSASRRLILELGGPLNLGSVARFNEEGQPEDSIVSVVDDPTSLPSESLAYDGVDIAVLTTADPSFYDRSPRSRWRRCIAGYGLEAGCCYQLALMGLSCWRPANRSSNSLRDSLSPRFSLANSNRLKTLPVLRSVFSTKRQPVNDRPCRLLD